MSNEITNLLTRGQLTDQVATFIQDTSDNRKAMIRVALDMGYREALQRHDWPGLIRWFDAAVSVAGGEAFFHLPEDVRTVIGIIDQNAPFLVDQFDIGSILDMTQGFVALTGGPVMLAYVGEVAINTRPSAATAFEALSSAADTRTLWIAGLKTGNVPSRESFTLNGTTPVALGSWLDITESSVDSTSTTLSVTIREDVGDISRCVIRPNTFNTSFKRYRLAPVPAQTTTLRVVYHYTPPPIFNDAHIYPIPVHNFLMEYAIASTYQSRRLQDFAAQHFAMAEAFLISAIAEVERGRVRLTRPYSPRPRHRFIQDTT